MGIRTVRGELEFWKIACRALKACTYQELYENHVFSFVIEAAGRLMVSMVLGVFMYPHGLHGELET